MSLRRPLSRRSFLRGAVAGSAVSLALPPLEAMIGRGDAWADGSVDGPIFGIFFWANGLPWHAAHTRSAVPDPSFDGGRHVDLWTPTTTGPGYAPSTLLAPIAAHAPTVITGLEPKTGVTSSGESDGHMRGFMVALTSDRVNPVGFHHNSHTLNSERETLDQFVARHPDFHAGGVPRFRSLTLGVSRARFHDYGHWNAISYNRPSSLNPPISDPGQLYDLLFSAPSDVVALGRRAALLDAVMEDYRALEKRLGTADRERMESHLDHLAEVQRRLDSSVVSCASGSRPGASGDLLVQTRTLADLLAIALQCGLTRVFSFMLTSPATTHVFSNLRTVRNDMHTTCHAGEWEAVRDISLYQMQAFSRLLTALASKTMPQGGSVLDASLIYGTSEYGEGWKHGVQEMPVVLAGTAGGRLKPGVHVREAGGNMAKAHVTLLRALGLPVETYGFHGAETSDTFGELLA